METRYILMLIDEMIEEWYKPPTVYYNRKKEDFQYQSYKRSAMEELKIYLITHSNEDPFDTIRDFRYQMDCFACEAKSGNANFMFSIYYDVATDVLDVLLSMK